MSGQMGRRLRRGYNWNMAGGAMNMPKDARIDVFLSAPGSQAKEIRGDQLLYEF